MLSKAQSWHAVLWLLFIHTTSNTIGSSYAFTTGHPHSTVQTLTKENFEKALNDPANGLWLLKFYGKCF